MKRRILAPVIVALATLASVAHAQVDPRKAQGESLFNEALSLHDKNRQGEALEKFEKSYAAFPNPNALYWIAREEQLLGRELSALRHFREAARNPLLYRGNLELAKKNIAELEPKLARVTISGPAGTTVKIADREVRLPLAADDVVDVDAGLVVVRGERDGTQYEARGTAVKGQSLALELQPVKDAGAAAAPFTEPPPARPAGESTWSGTKTAAVIVWAGAAAAGVTGAVLLGSSGSRADHGREITAGIPTCTGISSPACDEAKRDASAAADLKTGGWIAIGGAAALAVTGAVLFVLPSGNASSSTSVGLRGSSITLTHSF